MFCRSCGKEIPDDSVKCPACGIVQTITEIEYQTGAKSPLGAAFRRFREKPAVIRAKLILEGIGILVGVAAEVFAMVCPGDAFTFGARAVVVLLGLFGILGFGLLICNTLEHSGRTEV